MVNGRRAREFLASHYKMFSQHRFRNAPVSKIWCGCNILSSCALIPFRQARWHFVLAYDSLIEGKQLWKILLSKSTFVDLQAIVAGTVLIYYLRTVERRMGSRAFCNFLLLSFIFSFGFEAFGFSICKDWSFFHSPFFASGPYAVLWSCLVQYFMEVPVIPVGRVWNFPVSIEILPSLMALQMASISPQTLLACVSGVCGGFTYRLMSRYCFPKNFSLIPESLADLCYWISKPIREVGEDKVGRVLPIGATLEAQRKEVMDRIEERLIYEQMRRQNAQDGNAGVPFIRRLFGDSPNELPAVAPSEENIRILIDMGFTDRDQVTRALQSSNNDISKAANLLLLRSP